MLIAPIAGERTLDFGETGLDAVVAMTR